MTEKRTRKLQIRLTPGELIALQRKAYKNRLSMSVLIRKAVVAWVKRENTNAKGKHNS